MYLDMQCLLSRAQVVLLIAWLGRTIRVLLLAHGVRVSLVQFPLATYAHSWH